MRPRLMSEIVQTRHQLIPQISQNLMSEDSSIFSVNSNFYAAIFEFCQGSFPKTIWEYGILSAANPDNFKLLIVNTPINSVSTAFNKMSSTVISSFEGIFYIAIYFQIFDVEARGFTRPIIFTIANQCEEVIQNIYTHYGKEINDFVSRIQNPSFERFPNELMKFAKSLKLLQEKEQNNLIINSKMNELSSILSYFGINDISSEGAEERSFEYFSLINNDLRNAKDLCNFKEIVDDLEEFIGDLPTAKYLSNLQNLANYYETNYSIDFGMSSETYGFSDYVTKMLVEEMKMSEKDSETIAKVSIRKLVKTRVFFYIAFSLLSGQTLIIKTKDTQTGVALAKKLTVLCPFFKENELHICDSIEAVSCLKYSIVVCKDIIGEYRDIVSFLDIDTGYYSGDGCPPSSYVWKVLGNCTDISESAFILNVLLRLKHSSAYFVGKLAVVSTEGNNASCDRLLSILKEFGFSNADIPILKYWVHAYFNKNTVFKPILANNRSSTGLILAPF